MILWLYTNSSV